MAAKKIAEAIHVFRLNTLIYPENAAVFDSLGEAWESIGNKSAAIIAYQRVLNLKSGDANAKNRIAELRR